MKKEKMEKIIVTAVAIISVIIAGILYVKVMKNRGEYQIVDAVVTKCNEDVTISSKTGGHTYYDVKAQYNGKEYKVENVTQVYNFPEGSTVKVYLSNGKLFADKAGVQTSTPLAKVYFVFVFIALFTVPYSIALFVKKDNKNNK